jgi:hypothetical protein
MKKYWNEWNKSVYFYHLLIIVFIFLSRAIKQVKGIKRMQTEKEAIKLSLFACDGIL